MPSPSSRRLAFGALCLGLAGLPAAGHAQVQPSPPPGAASSPSAAPAPGAQRVDITGSRTADADERRESTAAKIVVGREEIERFGDATLADVLRRLPGVTAPGGGRGIRMRGLGAGYTQILVDGERMPPGFSLESLNPQQVERIEILRAPTAETGTRAMAGTIHIITREGFVKRLNDLQLGLSSRGSRTGGMASWTRNGGGERFSHNVSLSVMRPGSRTDTTSTTTRLTPEGDVELQQVERTRAEDRRTGVHATARLQWRLGPTGGSGGPGGQGDTLQLSPFLMRWEGGGHRDAVLGTLVGSPGPGDPLHERARTEADSRFTLARLNAQLRRTLDGDLRLEGRATLGEGRNTSRSRRDTVAADGGALASVDEQVGSRERSVGLSLKASRPLAPGHQAVAGLEAERARREETGTRNGAPVLPEADNLVAITQRVAVYAQDEWTLGPRWAMHLGGRWEGIRTTSDAAPGEAQAAAAADATVRHHSRVFTPVLHAVWKPDPKRRDQVRLSLARSYKSPTPQNLVARPALALDNAATRPDRIGNPALRPELATGIDLALERYLDEGGVLSANLFHRRITDLIRTVTTLQAEVPWAEGARWVARPENLGRATSQGLELEAKFRLDQWVAAAPRVDLRLNASVFRSRVHDVPGPDNRLDQQPRGTVNLGGDHRLRGLPLALGGSVSLTPATTTRLSATQQIVQSRQRSVDAYALWTVNPALKLRLSASNLDAPDDVSRSTVGLQSSETVTAGVTQWQLRWEWKL